MFDEIKVPLLEHYKENDFLSGGCYIFAKLVSERYGGEIYINRTLEHCAVKYHENLYDITGKIKNIEGFHPFRPGEEFVCQKEYLLKRKDLNQIKKICNL